MKDQLNELLNRLSDEGLKEARETALHSDNVSDFISYMEFDLAERQRALHIALEIMNPPNAKAHDH